MTRAHRLSPTRLVVALAIATVGLLATAGSSGAQSPAQDSVTGFVATGEGRAYVEFTFDVRSGPSGEDPTGTVSFDALLVDLGALEVSCLTVSGNRASMIALIPPSPAAPAGILISVEDNAGAGADRLAWDFVTTLPAECPVREVGESLLTGDIVVFDAPSVPISKDQCKKGGWQAFGFKNQGDCVSFVTHQAHQECLFIRATHGPPAFRAWYGTGVPKRYAMRRCVRQRSDG